VGQLLPDDSNDTWGHFACGVPTTDLIQSGPDHIHPFDCPDNGYVIVQISGFSCDLDVYALSEGCDPNSYDCLDGNTLQGLEGGPILFECAAPGDRIYLVVEGWGYQAETGDALCDPDGSQGTYTLEVLNDESTACNQCPDGPDGGDVDEDGRPDGCDNCPFDANASQADADGDTVGDACDRCPGWDDRDDADFDGWPDRCDLCPLDKDSGQEDQDGDGLGDVCDPCPQAADQADCPDPSVDEPVSAGCGCAQGGGPQIWPLLLLVAGTVRRTRTRPLRPGASRMAHGIW